MALPARRARRARRGVRRASEAEVLRPPGTAGAEVHADAQGLVVAVEDVRAVPRAVHPGLHDGGGVGLAARYVLAAQVSDPCLVRAVPGRVAVGVGVVEEAARGHVVAEGRGERGERAVRAHRTAAHLGPLLVDEREDGSRRRALVAAGGRRDGRLRGRLRRGLRPDGRRALRRRRRPGGPRAGRRPGARAALFRGDGAGRARRRGGLALLLAGRGGRRAPGRVGTRGAPARRGRRTVRGGRLVALSLAGRRVRRADLRVVTPTEGVATTGQQPGADRDGA
ncbi:hypothetical protein STTU_1695 [Streptomyces sp. Tu6071]|nr:hypothetical protein STTU_1695 [Streptomyces sp. Tu6071]